MLAIFDGSRSGTVGLIDGGTSGSTDWQGLLDGSLDATWTDPGKPGDPYVPPADPLPPVIVPPKPSLLLELVDANGVTWNLGTGAVRLTTAGFQGLGLPEVDFQTSSAAGVDGTRLTGWRLKERTVFLPVRFKGAATTDTTGLQRAFWSGLRIGSYLTFRVTDRDGAVRELTMRLKDDGGVSYKIQPDLFTIDAIGLTFTADDPWWYGEASTTPYSFSDGSGGDFFNGSARAPDFRISAATSSSGAFTLANPGDAPAWTVWTVWGPSVAAWSTSVDGHAIASSVPIAPGSALVLDTDPRRQTARLDGQRFPFRRFDSIDFAQIPPGETEQVMLSLTGTGMISAAVRPRYFRGF